MVLRPPGQTDPEAKIMASTSASWHFGLDLKCWLRSRDSVPSNHGTWWPEIIPYSRNKRSFTALREPLQLRRPTMWPARLFFYNLVREAAYSVTLNNFMLVCFCRSSSENEQWLKVYCRILSLYTWCAIYRYLSFSVIFLSTCLYFNEQFKVYLSPRPYIGSRTNCVSLEI